METSNTSKTLASEFFILQGELLLALSPTNTQEAESCYQQAIHIAQEVEAAMLELRAALRLSRLWKEQGHSEQARNLLSVAQAKMTEGFSTHDMKEASALLLELSK